MRIAYAALAIPLLAASVLPAFAADTRNYLDPRGFSLRIPVQAAVEPNVQENGQLDLIPNAAVVVTPNLDAFKNTNLGDASVSVGVSDDPAVLDACKDGKPAQGEKPAGTATLGGIKFMRFTFEDAGAGNRYFSTVYRGIADGNCYELVEFLHWAAIENFSPGAIKEFDRPKIEAELQAITRSFALKRGA